MPGRNIAAATSVTREARAGATDLPSIVQAFDRALGEAVQDIIVWAANEPRLVGETQTVDAASARRRRSPISVTESVRVYNLLALGSIETNIVTNAEVPEEHHGCRYAP